MKKSTSRARPFIETRKKHLKETAEDYTELIADITEVQGEARTCEVARQLGVSHVTAIRALQRLQKEGYIETAPHKPIYLTAKGKKLAAMAKKRHDILVAFLLKLGIPEEIALIDAEGMEHHISQETIDAMQGFVDGNR